MTRDQQHRSPGRSRGRALLRLAEQVLEAPDLATFSQVLTRQLQEVLGLETTALLVWNRKLDSFDTLSGSMTQLVDPRSAESGPRTRYLVSDGALLETHAAEGSGVLVPLLARSGLVGMLVLGERHGVGDPPYRDAEVRALTTLAARAALAVENQLYHSELIAMERMAALGTMAGTLAHDFRGPMTVIRGYAETLLLGNLTPEQTRDRASLIIQTIDRMERMTTETLDFARGGDRLARRTVHPRRLLAELAAGLTQEHPGLEVVVDFEIPEDVEAQLDVDKIARVLGNIAANAADAMGGRGRLHFGACLEPRGAGQDLCLVLRDEGPGVPESIRERLFEPFVTAGKKRGTGLGLAVARRFVEDHGGSLELEPQGPGARFRLLLPLGRDRSISRSPARMAP